MIRRIDQLEAVQDLPDTDLLALITMDDPEADAYLAKKAEAVRERMTQLIKTIKSNWPDCALTLSVGEKDRDTYQEWFDAGADRYLAEVLYRMKCAADQNVPITNYGIAIACMQGILRRSLALFSDLADMIEEEK